MSRESLDSTISKIMRNHYALYEGDLREYFRIIFFHAKNLNLPYHNFRHMMHVTWQCHNACSFYSKELNKRERRNLLIAATFHDFDHSGVGTNDKTNIELAILGLTKHILPEDKPFLKDISHYIEVTEFPYREISTPLVLCAQIIRDADLMQSLDVSWIQQVVFGLAAEWKQSPIYILKDQPGFLKNVKFLTEWAQEKWPKEVVDEKIRECTRLLGILQEEVCS